MINWNDVIVEQKIAQERYQEIVRAKQIARSQRRGEGSSQPKVNFYQQMRNWLTNSIANLGLSPKRSMQCCVE